MPGVQHLHVVAGEQHQPHVVCADQAASEQPVAERRPAGERPLAAHRQLTGVRHRPPAGREHTADRHSGAAVDLGRRVVLEIGRQQAAGGRHGEDPGHAGVGAREPLHRLDQRARRSLGAAEGRRDAEPKEVRFAERGDHLGCEPPGDVAAIGARGRNGGDGVDGCDGGGHGVRAYASAPSDRRPEVMPAARAPRSRAGRPARWLSARRPRGSGRRSRARRSRTCPPPAPS